MTEDTGSNDRRYSDLAHRLIVGLDGLWPTPREQAWLRDRRPAGIILFSRNVSGYKQLQALCGVLHELVPGCEIVADHEGGPVSQLSAAIGRPPSLWSLGVLDDLRLTRWVHRETGLRLRALGIDRVLAPCADVMTEARNPVVGVRAFGADGSLVSRHVGAAVLGLADAGLLACLKHWPGHGSSSRDSHLVNATVAIGSADGIIGKSGTAEDPYQAGLNAGADGLMVGHLIEGGGHELPVTLDAEVIGQARRSLATATGGAPTFYADDVTMGGLRTAMAGLGVPPPDSQSIGMVDPADLPREWLTCLLRAGCDRLLIRGIPWRAVPLESGFADGGDSVPMPISADGNRNRPAADSYRECRSRLLSRVSEDFFDHDLDLVWLDLTEEDRWQVAAGGENSLMEIEAALAGEFQSVLRGSPSVGWSRATESCSRLVVTSHRPLESGLLGTALPADFGDRTGYCLAMGHPSLGSDLKAHLGGKWSVDSLFDVYAPDLRP